MEQKDLLGIFKNIGHFKFLCELQKYPCLWRRRNLTNQVEARQELLEKLIPEVRYMSDIHQQQLRNILNEKCRGYYKIAKDFYNGKPNVHAEWVKFLVIRNDLYLKPQTPPTSSRRSTALVRSMLVYKRMRQMRENGVATLLAYLERPVESYIRGADEAAVDDDDRPSTSAAAASVVLSDPGVTITSYNT